MPENSTIRSFFLNGPSGRLEALLNQGTEHPRYAALVCHPHPLYGGTLHNKVVFHTMKALQHFGLPVLRFNFRGAGLSQGEHSNGVGEVEDVRVALDWLSSEFHLPLVFAGFSFGAAVGLSAACPDLRVKAVIAIGLPLVPVDQRNYDLRLLESCSKPKLFVSGARDQFSPSAKLDELVRRVPEPKKRVLIEGADHFFTGRLDEAQRAVHDFLEQVLQETRPDFAPNPSSVL